MTRGETRAALHAVSFKGGRLTLVRFIWQDARDAFVRDPSNAAHAIKDIKKFGADNVLYDIGTNERL